MSYDELEELCRKYWEEYFNNPCIDKSRKTDRGSYCFRSESKNTYLECNPEAEAL